MKSRFSNRVLASLILLSLAACGLEVYAFRSLAANSGTPLSFPLFTSPTDINLAVGKRVVTPAWGVNPEQSLRGFYSPTVTVRPDIVSNTATFTSTALPSVTPTYTPSYTPTTAVNTNTPTKTSPAAGPSDNEITNLPPGAQAPVQSMQTNVSAPLTSRLSVNVYDPENRPLDVTFYGRPLQAVNNPDFTIIVIPDPQYYSLMYPAIFNAQTEWIVNNRDSSNIIYVASLGDHVEVPEDPAQWMNAHAALNILDNAGVPYGLAAGNHDGAPSGTQNFNAYFGVTRFQGKPHYGGHYGNDNDNHFDIFSASGLNFIVIYIEYDPGMTSTKHPVLQWANGLLQTYRDRRAIVISHDMLQGESSNAFTSQGQTIYNALKVNPNLFLMLGGHLDVAARRTDTHNGNTIYTLRSDYQYVDSQRSGYLRIMRFSPADNMIDVSTYSPTQGKFYDKTDAGQSNFNLPYNMEGADFAVIGQVNGVASGGTASVSWTNLDASKPYQWFVTVSDGTFQTASDIWKFTTTAANLPPVAGDQAVTTNEDTALPITLAATDANGDLPSYSVIVPPSHGSLTGTAPNLLYTPQVDFHGADSFSFQASDGKVNSNTATVTITVKDVNDVPICLDVSLQTHNDETGQVDPACVDKEGDKLNYFIVDQPAHGTASATNRKLQYEPQAAYSGSDSFTYKTNDGIADSNVATVNVTVSSANGAPIAENQSVVTFEDVAIDIRLIGNDPDQDPLTYFVVNGPSHGTFEDSTYIPAANFNGDDSFTYQVNDGELSSNIATVTITVKPVNDTPVSAADDYAIKRNRSLEVPAPGVLVNDQDIEGAVLTATLVKGCSHGTLELKSDGSFVYTPGQDFSGEDAFTYQVSDPDGASSVNTVTIKVRS